MRERPATAGQEASAYFDEIPKGSIIIRSNPCNAGRFHWLPFFIPRLQSVLQDRKKEFRVPYADHAC